MKYDLGCAALASSIKRSNELIERLAAAYRAGELPDYMLEFIDSLRTRTTRTTS